MITTDELRTLFLFERLDDDQLEKVAAIGRDVRYLARETILTEGAPAGCFVVLLDGTISLSRRIQGGGELELNRTDHRGAYAGGIQALLSDEPSHYSGTVRTITDCRMLELSVGEFGALVREWFPMAVHLLDGMFTGMRVSQAKVDERERLIALGSVTAGLTHELNNPAAAAGRASAALREHVTGLRQKLARLADGSMTQAQLGLLTAFQEEIVQAAPLDLTPLEVSEREDELSDWLDAHGVYGAWELSPVFVAAGLDVAWAEHVAEAVEPATLPAAMALLGHTAETETLLGEIDDATSRISGLLAAAKQYSQMDRGPEQRVSIHELLDSTLAMMRHKIGSSEDGDMPRSWTRGHEDGDEAPGDRNERVRVVTDYDRTLPEIEVRAAELNQVWTNLIDNALDAMGGSGTLTVRTAADGDWLLVEIADSGPGIPEDIQNRIFEPFFTTKAVGKGTGLGLDISRRIVVERHGGDLTVQSRPGETRFQVRLPLSP